MLLNRITASLFLAFFFVGASIQAAEPLPDALKNIGVEEKLGEYVSLDVSLIDSRNRRVSLNSFLNEGKSLIINLAYYSCPMLCNLVASGLADGLSELSPSLANKYRVITVSIDPNDTAETLTSFGDKYLKTVENSQSHWSFYRSDARSINLLSESLGFKYKFNSETKQFAHSAAIMILTPDGQLSRVLYGIEFRPFDLKMGILESNKNQIISTVESVLLFCYNYDPQSRKYVIVAMNVMKGGGLLTMLAICIMWLILIKKRKDR